MNLFDHTQALTLSALNGMVRQAIEDALPDTYWVQAEFASLRESHGHCYMELIEKGENDNSIRAQARACCWKNTWLHVGRKFIEETGMPMRSGLKVLLLVHANFHESFGFSWIVDDVNPTFTLGDMAQRRQEIIRTLTEEGVIDLNKQLPISPFCKKIAVISSATAAGYGDFCNQLQDNAYGIKFVTQLFPAIMQGENVEKSVIEALDKILASNLFDCVVIIRGGGSTTDLSCFDTLPLAEHVANYPLPIITGIGHDRDKSVLDIVACVSVKTPTAVAEFLINNLATTLERIDTCQQRMANAVKARLEVEKLHLQRIGQQLKNVFGLRKIQEENKLKSILLKTHNLVDKQILIETNKLNLIEQKLHSLDPINILKKGYSIVLKDGVTVKDSATLSDGDELTLLFANGTSKATVKK